MPQRTWFITGVSSGFGRELTDQLLKRGDRVIGTVRDTGKVTDPDRAISPGIPCRGAGNDRPSRDPRCCRALVRAARKDRCDHQQRRLRPVRRSGGAHRRAGGRHRRGQPGRVDPLHPRRAAAPSRSGGGRVIQISSYGGQVAFAGNSLYHATKWGIEGFVESVAQEVASFGIGMTIVEPGGARTEFRYGSARVAKLRPIYDQTAAHSFLGMLDPKNGLAPGDPARMAARIIESADVEPAPLRMVFGSQALETTLTTLRKRIAGFEAQTQLAASTDFPPGA